MEERGGEDMLVCMSVCVYIHIYMYMYTKLFADKMLGYLTFASK